MKISETDANGQLKPAPDEASRRALMEAVRASGQAKAAAGPEAARSQDFLYDDEGLPK